MLQSYLSAALRNLVRNGTYAIINILGLALGFAAAIVIVLFVREEYSFDRFFPDHDRIFLVTETVTPPGEAPIHIAVTAANIGPAMKLDFPSVDAVTRLSASKVTLSRGDINGSAFVSWADPNFFRVFPMKVVAGNPDEALSRPDSLVLSRKMARRYFGRDDVVGETLELDRQHTMHVGAVIEDLPANTHFDVDVFGPGIASFSNLTAYDAVGSDPGALKLENVFNYVRLRSGARIEPLAAAMDNFALKHVAGDVDGQPVAKVYKFNLVPLTDIHLQPSSIADMKPPGDPRTLQTMVGVAALILFVAGSNFISMMTARAAGRAVEVAVRKAAGATRWQIVIQFMAECLVYTALAMALAMIVVERLLPGLNGFLQREIRLDPLRDPMLGFVLLAAWLLTGMAAGAYTALIISRFKPGVVLKGLVLGTGGSGRVRQALVIFQFGTLIALMVSTVTIQAQTQYAMEDRLRLPTAQIYIGRNGCPSGFREAVAQVPGVLASTCASGSALVYDRGGALFESRTGRKLALRAAPVGYGFFELFAVEPLAGRLFTQERGEDDVLRANPAADANPSLIINETAVRALGYATPQAAINEYRVWNRLVINNNAGSFTPMRSSRIVGVVPDFSVGSVRTAIEPTAYYIDPAALWAPIVKLDGRAIPETLRAVQALWRKFDESPFEGSFLSQRVNELYADIQRQSMIFSVFSGVAVMVAALGLLGLAVFTAERRTREIGLRKAMGASRWDILRLLGWQFAQPVLWANLIAWPLAYLSMRRWLEGFAYHIDMSPLVFVSASALALIIALATVAGHALIVARTSPVEALRYE